VGKYPFDKVSGFTFVDHPIVRTSVRNAAPNRMMARQVLTPEVSGTITLAGDVLASSSCQAHNCPGQNWAIAISRRTQKAAVCYYEKDLTDWARWFSGGELIYVDRGHGCDDDVPPEVLRYLQH
jgi:hypothetical protein